MAIAISAIALGACARLAPPLRLTPARSAAIARPSAAGLFVRIEAVRPSGALLRVRAEGDGPATLERVGAQGAISLLIAEPDTPARAALAQGVPIVDPGAAPGGRYLWRVRTSTSVAETDPIEIEAPPRAGPPPTLERIGRSAVRLRWSAPPGWGATIFRRAIGIEGALPESVASIAADQRPVWIDARLAPGAYAYRVAPRRLVAGVERYGEPSAQAYTTIAPFP